MSIVRTTEQARDLQHCSTSPCRVCGKGSRLTSDHPMRREFWCLQGEPVIPGIGPQPPRMSVLHEAKDIWFTDAWVCRKHKDFTGVVVDVRPHGQVHRTFIGSQFNQNDAQS